MVMSSGVMGKKSNTYKQETKDAAFQLWVSGMSMNKLGTLEEMPSKQTLWAWHNKYNWKKRKQDIVTKNEGKLDKDLTEYLDNQRKILNAMIGKFAKDINQVEIKPSDIINVMKWQHHLFGGTTERVEQQVEHTDFTDWYNEYKTNSKRNNKK